jgi:hypothetical protein
MTRPVLTLLALGIALFLAHPFSLLNDDTIAQLFNPPAIAQPSIKPASTHPIPLPTASPANTPQRLTITVSVSNPNDLKVKEGQDLKRGDLIADRGWERDRLTLFH